MYFISFLGNKGRNISQNMSRNFMSVTYIEQVTGQIDKIFLYASLISRSIGHDLSRTLSHWSWWFQNTIVGFYLRMYRSFCQWNKISPRMLEKNTSVLKITTSNCHTKTSLLKRLNSYSQNTLTKSFLKRLSKEL